MNKRIPRRQTLLLVSILLLCSLLDWGLIGALPLLGLSYGPVWPGVFLFGIVRILLLLITALVLKMPLSRVGRLLTVVATVLFQVGVFALAYDSFYIEPFRLTVTRLPIHAPAFLPGRDLRILQISDLHVERITQREQEVLVQAESLQPDIIVLTGDYINASYLDDPLSLQETRQILSQFHAPYGVFAVNGNTDNPYFMLSLFQGIKNIQVLNDEVFPLQLPGGILYLVGETYRVGSNLNTLPNLLASLPPHAYSILLYHTSDLIRTVASKGVDLYLSGHTHGGQFRLPFYGAIFTGAYYGKKYEMGKYTLGPTTLYVSRGLGMAGGLLPRARFLCPPELVLVELGK